MNPSVTGVPFRELARRNLIDLATIEREIFAVSFDNGKLFLSNYATGIFRPAERLQFFYGIPGSVPDRRESPAMNKGEALRVLQGQLQPWRERSYPDLCNEVGESRRFEATSESGTWYQGDVRVFWDDKPDGAIRVVASIDDGGWRAFVPVTADFILAPDGTCVGE